VITSRTVIVGSALPVLVLVTLAAVPGARLAVGIGSGPPPVQVARGPGGAGPAHYPVTLASRVESPAEAKQEKAALRLLRRSARVGAVLEFSGTQIVSAWHSGGTTSEVLDVVQTSGGGRTLVLRDAADGTGRRQLTRPAVGEGSLGPAQRALDALAAAYQLRPDGRDTVAGRSAVEVVATRAGREAARMWLDDETGLLLRQDVLDGAGRMSRMSAFLDLKVGKQPENPPAWTESATSRQVSTSPVTHRTGQAWSHVVTPRELQRFRSAGWPCPERLPEEYQLIDVRGDESTAGGQVLQLTYGDGLSDVSVFLQQGTLDGDRLTGMTTSRWGDGVVHVRHGWPELMVWQGGPTVITAVGDAEPAYLRTVLAAFPQPSRRGALGSLQDAMGSAVAWFTR
jgi:negative regulator of sigma E activity